MFDCSVFHGLLLISTALASSLNSHRYEVEQRATVPDNTEAFVQSLKLAPSQAQDLMVQASSGPTVFKQVRIACLAAQYSLGSNSVESKPVNQALEDANWSEACWEAPSCIIIPASTQEVSKALKIVKFFQTKFSVRSGGHSPNPGWSNVNDNGLLIDLRRINQLSVSSDGSVVSLGPGLRWGDVYNALDSYGVSLIGGRIPQVGVGGLILGGGFFHFSGEYGLAADNAKNFEIVLADGTITDASANQNSDLFWALKGGGPNFGIVTRFDLYTIPVKAVWYQVAIYTADQVPAILDAFAQWQTKGASDLKSTVALIIGLETTTLGLIYSAAADKPAAFAPFYDLVPLVVAVPPTNGTVKTLTDILGSTFSQVPARHDYRGTATKIDVTLYKEVYGFWREKALAVRAATGANQTFTLQPVPANIAKVGAANGGNPLGLPPIDHQWWTTLVDWQGESNDDAVRAVPIATTQEWKDLGQARGSYLPFLYMNDASRDQNPIAGYGASNVAKLKSVSKKYDPTQVFQILQNDGFLLRKA